MTKQEAMVELGIDESKIDYALPEKFVDEMRNYLESPLGHFVWSYEENSIFGFPRPLTTEGNEALVKYNAHHGTQYDTEKKVLQPLNNKDSDEFWADEHETFAEPERQDIANINDEIDFDEGHQYIRGD